jgi:hypothetical protein
MTESDIYLGRQGKAQAQMYQRTVNEWERQRNRLEMEHGELMSRVDYLSDEVRVSKKKGTFITLAHLSDSLHRLC